MNMIQNCRRLTQRLTLALMLMLALAATGCARPVHSEKPEPTPTWGVFYPTVVPWVPTATGTPLSRPTGTPLAVPTQQSRPTGSKEKFL